MGRNQQQSDTNITGSVEDDEERQIRINRNLARFLAEQTSQPRIAQKRQSHKKNVNLSVGGVQSNSSLISQKNNPNKLGFPKTANVPTGFHIQSNTNMFPSDKNNHNRSFIRNSGSTSKSKDEQCSSETNVLKEQSYTSRDEEERQNILNNNVTFSGGNVPQMSDIKGHKSNVCHNRTNTRCTMTVSKLIGRSLTFAYNHDGMLDPMDLLDPELRPIPPQPGCEPSMQIYQDHRRMATDYLNVRTEIVEMRQRKHELEETLKKSDDELLRSVITTDRSQQASLPPTTGVHAQPDPAEVEKYLQMESEKDNLVQLRDKLTTQLDLIKQAQLKQSQQSSGITLPTSKPTISTNVGNTNPQDASLTPEAIREKCTTTKALALSLAPSVAMSLGAGSIPPTVITPPTNEQITSLIPHPVSFTRQISSNSVEGDSDWVVVKQTDDSQALQKSKEGT